MKRWLVFDRVTANAADHPERSVELDPGASVADALAETVQSARPVVLVVPAGPDRATVARITPPARQDS